MKKLFLLIFFIFSLLRSVFSQDMMANFKASTPSFISANIGCAFPIGRYANKSIYGNYNNPYEGIVPKLPLSGESQYLVGAFALPGINVSLNGTWYFLKFLGLGVRASINQNFLAVKKLSSVYANAYGSDNDVYSFDFITDDFYYTFYVMPGLYFAVPIVENVYFSLEAGFGPFCSHFPKFLCKYTNNDVAATEITNSAGEWDFSYYLALGTKIKLGYKFGLNIECTYSDFYVKYDLITKKNNIDITTSVPVFHRNLSLNAGLVYFFSK